MLPPFLESIKPKEWRFVFITVAFLFAIITFPYIYGWLRTPEGGRFTGSHGLTIGDFSNYYSYIEQIAEGGILVRNLNTHETWDLTELRLGWLGVGMLARVFGFSAPVAFHVSRILLAVVFAVLSYVFIAFFVADVWRRRLTFLLLLFSGGVGAWLYVPLLPFRFYENGYYHWPMDLWVPEAFTFLTLYHVPHFILALLFFVGMLLFFFWAVEYRRLRFAVFSGLCGLFLFSWHPFHLISLGLIILVYSFVRSILDPAGRRATFWSFVITWFLSLPPIVVYAWYAFITPAIASTTEQLMTITTVWWLTIVSFGFLLVFSVIAIVGLSRSRSLSSKWIFFLVWFVVQAACLYAPVPWQRRLTTGFHIPLVFFAAEGVWWVKQWLFKRSHFFHDAFFTQALVSGFFFVLVFATAPLMVVLSDVYIFTYLHETPYYISKDYNAAFYFLRAQTPQDAVVMGGVWAGNLLPGFVVRPTYLAHDVLTAYYEDKTERVQWFYNLKTSHEDRRGFLREQGIDYFIVGPDELGLDAAAWDNVPDVAGVSRFSEGADAWFERVFSSGAVSVYRLLPASELVE